MQHTQTLVVQLPTPNVVALQGVLTMCEAARAAVRHLRVCQQQYTGESDDGVHTPWFAALPAAFPHLHTLHISRLSGLLPPPTQLPLVRQLHLGLRAAKFISSARQA